MALFTNSGEKKELFCKKCNKFTEHRSISRTEAFDLGYIIPRAPEFKTLARLMNIYADNTPIAPVLDGQPYLCTVCNHYRTNGGLLGDML